MMFDFLAKKISTLFDRFGRSGRLTPVAIDDFLRTVHDSLLDADVPLAVGDAFVNDVRSVLTGVTIPSGLAADDFLKKVVYERLVSFLGGQVTDCLVSANRGVVLVMGLQGSGKTTTVAKLGRLIRERNECDKRSLRVMVASVDFYRPAAIDQLALIAQQASLFFYRPQESDPTVAARAALSYQKEHGYDLLILDTAGRLHVDGEMLDELCTIKSIVKPSVSLLVLDAMTGQESLRVATTFNEKIGFDAAVLTKTDSDTRGGAAFAFRYALKKPIAAVGTGEKSGDLALFHPKRAASSMLGMGDLESFVELANARIRDEDQKRLTRALSTGKLTLEDFACQIDAISRLGSISQVLKFLPGMASHSVSPEKLEEGEQEMRRFKVIIGSMTRKERLLPAVIDTSRKKRIARGAGVAMSDVQDLLNKFSEMQHLMKQMGRFGLFRGRK
ncbi:MAG: signal recognition particle protein [Candidatus Babeliaceae bacterium]|nr:signal recognition particle protein [Candidatus Babeliaceae bacterium]